MRGKRRLNSIQSGEDVQMDSRSDQWIQGIQILENETGPPSHQNQAKTIERAPVPFFLSLPQKIKGHFLREVCDRGIENPHE